MFELDAMLIRLMGDASSYNDMMKSAETETAKVDDLTKQATQSTQKFTTASERMAAAHKAAKAAVANGAGDYKTVFNEALKAIKENEAATKSLNKTLEELHAKTLMVAYAAREAGSYLSQTFGGFVINSLKAAAAFEQTNVAFGTMLGSALEAKTLLEDLTTFAALTPFEMPEIEQAARGLVQFGERGTQLMETLEILGNASSGTSSNFGEIALIFNQVRGVGKLLTQDFRQLSTRGIISLDDIAKHFKKTREEANAMLSSGKIGFNDLRNILKGLSEDGGRFANMMEKQSKTLAGLWSTLTDNIGITSRSIGETIVPMAKDAVEVFIGLTEAIRTMPGALKAGIAVFAGLGAATGTLATGFAGLLLSIAGVKAVIPILSGAYTTLRTITLSLTSAQTLYNLALVAGKAAAVAAVAVGSVAVGYWISAGNSVKDYTKALTESQEATDRLIARRSKAASEVLESTSKMTNPEEAKKTLEESLKGSKNEMAGMEAAIRNTEKAIANDLAPRWYTLWQGGRAVWKGELANVEEMKKQYKALQNEAQAYQDALGKFPEKAKAKEEDTEAAKKYLKDLTMTMETFGMTTEQAKLYKLELENIDAALITSIEQIQNQIKAQELEKIGKDRLEALKLQKKEMELLMKMSPDDTQASKKIANQLELEKLAKDKMLPTQIDAIKKQQEENLALEKSLSLRSKANDLIKAMRTPMEALAAKEAELAEMHKAGVLPIDQYNKALRQAQKDFKEASGEAQHLKDTLSQDLGGAKFSSDAVGLKKDLQALQRPSVLPAANQPPRMQQNPVMVAANARPTASKDSTNFDKMVTSLETIAGKEPIKVTVLSSFV